MTFSRTAAFSYFPLLTGRLARRFTLTTLPVPPAVAINRLAPVLDGALFRAAL
ncbi:hypothetical protein [Sedimentitalea xiamensis]|uniref:hypothetical protein n=1 Tax=Sedimentitalea xiamensis TaxID=3050037 RepID=UPI0025415833|nr:hypothetical protein [Sedimentitalea xiamensis]